MPTIPLELPIRAGYSSSMGFGGLMVHEHYRKYDDNLEESDLVKKFK